MATSIPAAGGGGSGTVHTDGVTTTGVGSVGDPIAGLPSSAGNAGTMSAANFVRIANGFDFDGWIATNSALMKANAPGITNIKFGDAGLYEIGNTLAVINTAFTAQGSAQTGMSQGDAGMPGGGKYLQTSKALARAYTATPKTGQWALCYEAKLATGSSYNVVGHSDTANSHDVGVGVLTADTNYWMINQGAHAADSGVAADNAIHTFIIASNGTTVKLLIDGTVRGAGFAASLIGADEPVFPYGYGSSATGCGVGRFLFGY